uniref:Retrotransposon gag domain-containing protein n=2 Tax=Nymphaea colorata TaxID=210225 RepID=A0A5K1DIR4_9MAGN
MKRELQNRKKGGMSMTEYLQHISFLHDSLSRVQHFVSDTDLVLYTLNGLNSEYESFITTVTVFKDLPSWSELYDTLITQER